jgi:hypothetical protein
MLVNPRDLIPLNQLLSSTPLLLLLLGLLVLLYLLHGSLDLPRVRSVVVQRVPPGTVLDITSKET